MKKQKLTAFFLTAALTAASLAGCAQPSGAQNSSAASASPVAADSSSAAPASSASQASGTDSDPNSLLNQIKQKGVLLVGTEGTYSPFSYHDSGDKLVGFDVEIAEAVAGQLGVKAQFVETKWDSMIAGLDAKRFDVVFNQVGITDERKQKYDFSTPYTVTRAALIVHQDDTAIKSFDDLKGKKSAQSLTSNYAQMAQQFGAQLVGTDGFNQSADLVIEKRADATINDDIAFYDYKKQKPDAPIKIAATQDDASQNAALIRKGNDSLVKAIDDALAKLTADGTLSRISDKYFDKDVTK